MEEFETHEIFALMGPESLLNRIDNVYDEEPVIMLPSTVKAKEVPDKVDLYVFDALKRRERFLPFTLNGVPIFKSKDIWFEK
jgi:hypothetical protein